MRKGRKLLQSIGASEKNFRTSLLIAVLFLIIGGLVFVMEKREDTASAGYLERGDYGSGSYSETIRARLCG